MWWSLTRSHHCLMTQISPSLLLSTCCVRWLSEWKYLPTNYQEEGNFLQNFHLKCIYLTLLWIKFAPCGMLKFWRNDKIFATLALPDWVFRMLGGKMTDTWCQLSFEGIQPSVNIKVGHITIMMTFALHHRPNATLSGHWMCSKSHLMAANNCINRQDCPLMQCTLQEWARPRNSNVCSGHSAAIHEHICGSLKGHASFSPD